MTTSRKALIATAFLLGAGAAAPAGAEPPQVWGSPNGSQMMLQCLRQAQLGQAQVSVSSSGVVSCCRQGFCIACDGPETCQVGGLPFLDGTMAPSTPAEPAQPGTALPQMQLRIQR